MLVFDFYSSTTFTITSRLWLGGRHTSISPLPNKGIFGILKLVKKDIEILADEVLIKYKKCFLDLSKL